MFCKNCGLPLPENAKFCKECGTPAMAAPIPNTVQENTVPRETPKPTVRTCANCGHELPENVKFCKECGTPIAAIPVPNTVQGSTANRATQENTVNQTIRENTVQQEAPTKPIQRETFSWQEPITPTVPKTTSLLDRLKTDASLRNKVIAAAAVLLVIVSVIAISSRKNPNDDYNYVVNNTTQTSQTSNDQNQSKESSNTSSSGSQSNGNSSTNSTSAESSSSKTNQKVSTFSMTTSQGEKLEVQPGYSYVAMTHILENSSGRSASVLIPTIFNYAKDTYTMGSESEKNGYYSLTFKTDGKDGIDFVANYVSDLSRYGFTLEKTINISSNQVLYLLNYNGNITHGAASWVDTTYDMSVSAYKDYLSTIVVFDYPKEVGFDLGSSGSTPEYSSAKVSTSYSFDGKNRFKISGWGSSGNDYITLYFDPGSYGTGDTLKTKDFQSQSGAGQNALCHVSISGDTLGNDLWSIYVDDLDTVEVKILESSDSCLAVSYYIEVTKGSHRYTLEGVCAAELAGGAYAGEYETPDENNNSVGPGIGIDGTCVICHGGGFNVCSSCRGAGTKKCHNCGGDGLRQCSLCNGTGLYYNFYTGNYSSCTGCQGRGAKTCTSCTAGSVKCTMCGGLGKTTCSACGGTGKNF